MASLSPGLDTPKTWQSPVLSTPKLCHFWGWQVRDFISGGGQFRTLFYHGPDVSRAMVMWPPCWRMTRLYFIEQMRTNMSQPGRRPGTALGDKSHVLKALLSRKDILTLRGGPWVCAVSALVF